MTKVRDNIKKKIVSYKPSKIFGNPESVGYKLEMNNKYSSNQAYYDVYQLKDNQAFIPFEQAKIE